MTDKTPKQTLTGSYGICNICKKTIKPTIPITRLAPSFTAQVFQLVGKFPKEVVVGGRKLGLSPRQIRAIPHETSFIALGKPKSKKRKKKWKQNLK